MKQHRLILLIEDNPSFRLLLNHFLSKHFQVITKKDGIDAMRWLEKGNRPDLVLLDLAMPEMSGNDFLVGLKSSGFYGDIPVIIISGNHRNTFNPENLNEVQYYFEKPFDPRKLKEKIDNILEQNVYLY